MIVEARQLVAINVAGGQSGFVLLSGNTRSVKDSLPPWVLVCSPLCTQVPGGRIDCAPPQMRAVARRASLNVVCWIKTKPKESASALMTMMLDLVSAGHGLSWTPCRQVDTLADRVRSLWEGPDSHGHTSCSRVIRVGLID